MNFKTKETNLNKSENLINIFNTQKDLNLNIDEEE